MSDFAGSLFALEVLHRSGMQFFEVSHAGLYAARDNLSVPVIDTCLLLKPNRFGLLSTRMVAFGNTASS